MADRLEVFPCTVPPQTTAAAPAFFPLVFDAGYVVRWEVVIPRGVAGLAGFRFAYGTQPVIPDTQGGWIIGDDDKVGDDLDVTYTGQQWVLVAYNTDVFPHTFYVRMYVNNIGHPGRAPVTPVTASLIDLNGGPRVDLAAPLTADDVTLPDLSDVTGDLTGVVGLPDTLTAPDSGTSTLDESAPPPSTDITPDVADTPDVTDTTDTASPEQSDLTAAPDLAPDGSVT